MARLIVVLRNFGNAPTKADSIHIPDRLRRKMLYHTNTHWNAHGKDRIDYGKEESQLDATSTVY